MTLNRHINIMIGIVLSIMPIVQILAFKVVPKLLHNGICISGVLCIIVIVLLCIILVALLITITVILSENGSIYFLNFTKTKLENFVLLSRPETKNGVFKQNLYNFCPPAVFIHRFDNGYDIIVVENRIVYNMLKNNKDNIICSEGAVVIYHENISDLVWNLRSLNDSHFKTSSKEVFSKFNLMA